MRRALALSLGCAAHREVSLGEGFMESLPMPHQGVRRDSYYSSISYPLSCEDPGIKGGLEGEDLPWAEARRVFRRFAASDNPSSEERSEMSDAAWRLSYCWCNCGSCPELFHVCPLGAMAALNLMQLSSAMSSAARVGSFINSVSECSHVDPYVMIVKLPPWNELLYASWPIFGIMYRVALQLQVDGLQEEHLDAIWVEQLLRGNGSISWPRKRNRSLGSRREGKGSFCELLGFGAQCPVDIAAQLVGQALAIARTDPPRGREPLDAIEALVRRAQSWVYGLLPRVPGVTECMQSQNLHLGLSLSRAGRKIFRSLAQLQTVLEASLHATGPHCPAGGARWQGEWLFETDFLKDFQAELGTTLALAPNLSPAATAWPQVREAREAWVCTLFAGPEISWEQVALHAELVRTLAYSIRRHSQQQRPFVVLTEVSIPEDIRLELLADGLLLEYFHAPSLRMQVPAGYEWKLSWFKGRKLRPTMGQLAVWNLSYDTVVMLDDDMIMVQAADELFTTPVFAMSHDPMPSGHAKDTAGHQITRLNNAVRVVQPNKQLFRKMVARLQSGAYKDHALISYWGYDLQSLEDAFWSEQSRRSGVARYAGGQFLGCAKLRAGVSRAKRTELADTLPDAEEAKSLNEVETIRASDNENVHCVLPADYNFFVDFKSVFTLIFHGVGESELKAWSMRRLMRRATMLLRSGSLVDAPKILHWPGGLRKPWQRVHPRTQTDWDRAWWDAHHGMCQESATKCRIACEFEPPVE
ncbi:unnamed protein product [Effrenium voratum]|nr:unnamed protein product [Effrenium voratum]